MSDDHDLDLDDDGPATLVPNRLLARLLEYDSCPHAADYVCTPCGDRARDAAISLLEEPSAAPAPPPAPLALPDNTAAAAPTPGDLGDRADEAGLRETFLDAIAQAAFDVQHPKTRHPEVCPVCEMVRRLRAALVSPNHARPTHLSAAASAHQHSEGQNAEKEADRSEE